MVTVIITRDEEGNICSCELHGHAGAGEAGYDIVCAAVSVLAYSTGIGLEKVARQEGEYKAEEGYGLLRLTGEKTEQGQVLLRTMELALEDIADKYPDFVTIKKV